MQAAEGALRRRGARLLGALLLSCLLAHPSAQAQTAYGAPSAQSARQASGVVGAWNRLIEGSRGLGEVEKAEAVNRFFNQSIAYEADDATFDGGDHWATPMELMKSGRGDCEDFAIAKYVTLQMLGIPGERLRLMYVHLNTAGPWPAPHMVLGYQSAEGADPLVLDNMIDSLRPASTRTDLGLVYSFNATGLWVGGATHSAADPLARMRRWRDVQERMRAEGTPDLSLARRAAGAATVAAAPR